MLRAVVFDMDGVLIDSEPVIRAAAQRAGEDTGHEVTDAFYASLLGLPGPQVEAAFMVEFGQGFPLDEFRRRFEHHYREHVRVAGIPPKPGVPALLADLARREVPRAVATSTQSRAAHAALASAGLLDWLPVVVTGDQVAAGKPAPDIFLQAARRLAVAPEHCVAVEDSDVGARAAVAAGMVTLLVPDLTAPSEELARIVSEVLPSMEHAAARILALLAPGGTDGGAARARRSHP